MAEFVDDDEEIKKENDLGENEEDAQNVRNGFHERTDELFV